MQRTLRSGFCCQLRQAQRLPQALENYARNATGDCAGLATLYFSELRDRA